MKKITTASDIVEIDPSEVGKIDISFLPFAAKNYHISPDINDYVIFTTVICPADIPNRNGIAFPLAELAKFTPTPSPHFVYKGWIGCPVHEEHCLSGDTVVRTAKGLKRIDRVKVGDKVLTHKNRYRKVTRVFDNGVKSTMRIDALGMIHAMTITPNHKVWVVDSQQLYRHGRAHSWKQRFKHATEVFPHWREASDVYNYDYLVFPIHIGGNIEVSDEYAFLTGVYMAEGSLGPNNKDLNPYAVNLTIGYAEKEFKEKILECCEALGYKTSVSFNKHGGTCLICIRNKEFAKDMKRLCGTYSHKKRMRNELRKWNDRALIYFLAGYINGDGSTSKKRIRCVTASQNLAQDLQMSFAKLGIPAAGNGSGWAGQFTDKHLTKQGTIRKNKGGKPWRETHDSYTISVVTYEAESVGITDLLVGYKRFNGSVKSGHSETRVQIFGDYMLFPISHIIYDAGEVSVYNLEVEEDNSYVANGVVVHNCNEDPTKAVGIIFDTSLVKMPEEYGNGKLYNVIGVLGIDKKKRPDLAKAFANGDVNTVSMGAFAGYFTCSICGALIDDEHKCQHIQSKDAVNFKPFEDVDGNIQIAFLNAHDLEPIETSIVKDPAWAPALSDTILQK